jgi:hypothetical protein
MDAKLVCQTVGVALTYIHFCEFAVEDVPSSNSFGEEVILRSINRATPID